MDKKGFLNPQIYSKDKLAMKSHILTNLIEFENMLIDFLIAGYTVSFKEVPKFGAVTVNIATKDKNTGNQDWILSDFHDTPSEALATSWWFHFHICSGMPWADENVSVKKFG